MDDLSFRLGDRCRSPTEEFAMDCTALIYVAIVTFGALSPFVNNDNATLRQCRDAGIVVTGRDPFFGTGLCGPFLPVHAPADV